MRRAGLATIIVFCFLSLVWPLGTIAERSLIVAVDLILTAASLAFAADFPYLPPCIRLAGG